MIVSLFKIDKPWNNPVALGANDGALLVLFPYYYAHALGRSAFEALFFFWKEKERESENPVPPAFDASLAACPELHVRRRNVKRPLDNSGVNTVGGENYHKFVFFPFMQF